MAKINSLDRTMKIFSVDTNLQDCFKYNLFSEQSEYNKVPCWGAEKCEGDVINGEDITDIRYYLTTVHNFEPHKSIVEESCFLQSKKYRYHPVKNFIESQSWDGVKRLDSWMVEALGCTDNSYVRDVSRKIMIAAVNRVYNPGCKFDHMLIIEGRQGIGKSTLIEELAGEFYLDTTFENKDKDLVDSICKALLVEISELSGMGKKDVEWMKGFITRKVDRVRLPYAARTKDFKRKCIFIGTYNPSGNNTYLKDDTGNRRFWPIECTRINIGYIKDYRCQLWAEAYDAYKRREPYYLTDKSSLDILKGLHEDREFDGPAYDKIRDWLLRYPRDEVEMVEIVEGCLEIKNSHNMKEMASIWSIVGIIMRKMGWIKGTNKNRRKYYPPKDFYKHIEEEEWSD